MKHYSLLSLVALLILSCETKTTEQTPIHFNSLDPKATGVDFVNTLTPTGDMNIIEYLYYFNGGGVGIIDIDNDGFDDLFFTGNQTPDKLYRNLGNMKFEDISTAAGIGTEDSWSTGVTVADINNDGYQDLYISKVSNYKSLEEAHHMLYINNGDRTFSERSSEVGLDISRFGTQASFFDYDNDGDLDVYLLNHSIHTPRNYGRSDQRSQTDELAGDLLLENKLNEGSLHFVDVTQAAGIYSSSLGYGLGLSTTDLNMDGHIDIYVGNDFHENDYIYLNQGDKTFKEVSNSALSHSSRFTMGLDAADINNDGLTDVFSLDMMPYDPDIFLKSGGEDSDKVSQIKESFGYHPQFARNHVQINNGNETFKEVAMVSNLHATDWSWSVLIQDYDNDGMSDIFISNGIYKRPNDLDFINYESDVDLSKFNEEDQDELELEFIKVMPSIKIPNVVFKNNGDYQFDRFTTEAGLSDSYSNGTAYSDLDNDGDLDIVVNNINEPATILENNSVKNNFLSLQFDSKLNPFGAKVYAYKNGSQWYRELTATRGFESASTQKIHFGLGSIQELDSLKVIWLDQKTTVLSNVKANQQLLIDRKSTSTSNLTKSSNELFTVAPFDFVHRENDFNDYDKEPLMPERLSIEGPALERADFNGDGLDDLFIGGGKYQASELFLQQKDGTYLPKKLKVFELDAIHEDEDAEAFDFDKDGDLDLYVVSGGNEYVEGVLHTTDRMYINNGKADFIKYPAALPSYNGGSISAGDYDGDGYEDLFLGTRSMPGGYGLSPNSYILKNTQKANFEMAAHARLGMITDSEWADLNNDGLLDLVFVGDWMPVTILINIGDGKFDNQTEEFGLIETQGMWNCVKVADVDQNGTMDIIAGNAGLNLKWKASKEHPIQLYLDDYDENTFLDPIIFYNFFGENVPFASKDKLISQIPALKKYFVRYSDFAKAKDIHTLTGKDSIMQTKSIKELRSMVFLNENNTKYNAVPLPIEAQLSTIEDVYFDNGDLYYVGNYSGYVTELGPSKSNAGGVLSHFKNGNFTQNRSLGLPANLEGRKIDKISDKTFIILTNNDSAYTITKKN